MKINDLGIINQAHLHLKLWAQLFKKLSLTKSLVKNLLTLKAPIMTAADDIHKYFFILFLRKQEDVSSESSARQWIHLKKSSLIFFER